MEQAQGGPPPDGPRTPGGKPGEAEKPGRFAFHRSRLAMGVLAVVLIGVTAFLGFLSISPQKRRRITKKARQGVQQAVSTVYEGDLSQLPGYKRLGKRLGLFEGTMPQAATASAPEKKKTSGDPESAKIQRQMDELMESIDGFTGTSAAGRPLAPGAKQPASRGTAPPPAAAKQSGALLAGSASGKRLEAGPTGLRGVSGMAGGFARPFDSMRFQNKRSAPAAQYQDPTARAGPMIGNAFQQANSLKGMGVPEAPSTPTQAPVQEQPPAGRSWLSKASGKIDAWLVKLGLGESVFVKLLRKATGASPRGPAPAATPSATD